MSGKFRNESIRLQNWDYSWAGSYFVTIKTHYNKPFFGSIKNGRMFLSEIGIIAQQEWLKTPEIRPDMNIFLDEFIVMPDHIHGIIKIARNEYNSFENWDGRDAMHRVPTSNNMHRVPTSNNMHQNPTSNNMHQNPTSNNIYQDHTTDTNNSDGIPTFIDDVIQSNHRKNQFGPQKKNLASILRGFKSAVTIKARRINSAYAWQSRFHDHLIRDEEALYSIRNYIQKNPYNWSKDNLL
ncbi:transposase [Bacteroidota bacterium]